MESTIARPPAAPSRPSLAWAVVVSALLIAFMAWLRLTVYTSQIVPLTYVLPLLVCLWHRRRWLLWVMAVAFLTMTATKMLWILPRHVATNPDHWVFMAMQVANIAIAAGVIDVVLRLRQRIEQQNAALETTNHELVASNEELAAREEEISRQNEELQTQAQEMEQQAEELQTSNETLAHRENTLQALFDLAQPYSDEQALLARICELTPELLGAETAAAAILEHREGMVWVRGHFGFGVGGPRPGPMKAEETLTAIVQHTGQTAAVEDLVLRPDLKTPQPQAGPNLRSVLASPLWLGRQIVGDLEVYVPQPQRWTAEQARMLQWLADQCARVWEILRLREQRRLAEQELRQLNGELEHRVAQRTAQLRALACELTQTEDRERQRLAQVLHDDLQQMLVAAKMQASMLRGRVGDPDIHQATDRIEELLQQSIDTSRSLTAELAPPVLYEGTFSAVLNWLAREAQEKHALTVTVNAESETNVRQPAMRSLLFQAVRELLFNVVKHSNVTEAQVRMERTQRGLEVGVSDRGVGFDVAGVCGDGARRGMGLFAVQERLKLLGGELEIQSQPGQGTSVTLIVPDVPEEAGDDGREESGVAAPLASEMAYPQDGDRLRVLLVDDHKIVREGLAGLLREEEDIEVVGQAGDGLAAIELTRQLRPDVVVMDVTMPRVNGIEATRQITADLPGTRIIGLSMHEQSDMEQAMRQAGAAAYLPKDGPAEVLITTIRRCALMEPERDQTGQELSADLEPG